MENTHDPREVIRGLQQILINNTIRIGFLFGAGTSMAAYLTNEDGEFVRNKWNEIDCLIPGVKKMTQIIVDAIEDKDYVNALEIIKSELEDEFKDDKEKESAFMLENIVSSIDQKIRVVGKDTLCGLSKDQLLNLRNIFQTKIKDLVSVHKNESIDLEKSSLLHRQFARWIKYASRKSPIEVFTTNYDYLFEIGFESEHLSYFDGFVGGYKPFFDPISVENNYKIPDWTRLWKLHGSLGWGYDKKEKKIIRSRDVNEDGIVIYPSLLKYDDSRKQPYLSYIERLSSFLKGEDGVLFICGYSFGDDHINETIINSVTQSKNTTVIALVFEDDLDESSVAIRIGRRSNKFTICGKKEALYRGVLGKWQLKREPPEDDFTFIDQFFDRDSPEPVEEEGKGDEIVKLTGDLKLVDFRYFVKFLIELSYPSFGEKYDK